MLYYEECFIKRNKMKNVIFLWLVIQYAEHKPNEVLDSLSVTTLYLEKWLSMYVKGIAAGHSSVGE